MTESLSLIMAMGCVLYKLLPAEVIRATTIHAAKSMGRDGEIGSLDPGKQADLLLLDIPNYRYLPYHFGVNHTDTVIKKGKVVYSAPRNNQTNQTNQTNHKVLP